jgi:iron complex outermembrane receptor protein
MQAPISVSPTLNAGWGYGISWDQQAYLSEQLSLCKDHLIISGGYTHADYRQYASDLSRSSTAQNKVHANLPNAAVVVKLVPDLALFADTTRQSQPNGTSPSTGANPTTTGKQYEFGLRAQLFDRRVYSTVTYFNISQNNFSIPNQGNIANPPPDPLLPPIFTDRKVKGVEWEMTAAINDQISIIGNFAYTHARTPLGQVFRGVAEHTAGALLNYRFDEGGPLQGLSLGVGIDYLAKRPGDNPSPNGYIANDLNGLVIGQPTFYLPARVLINVMASYRFSKHWRAQLNIDNVMNADYMEASTARNTVFPGTPINPRLTITYTF